ncbi:hypothetical protein YC2023_042107 [Brassica napus]
MVQARIDFVVSHGGFGCNGVKLKETIDAAVMFKPHVVVTDIKTAYLTCDCSRFLAGLFWNNLESLCCLSLMLTPDNLRFMCFECWLNETI